MTMVSVAGGMGLDGGGALTGLNGGGLLIGLSGVVSETSGSQSSGSLSECRLSMEYSESFSFLNKEEVLYSVKDIKKKS